MWILELLKELWKRLVQLIVGKKKSILTLKMNVTG